MNPALATVLLVLSAGILFVIPMLPALIELRLKRDAHPLNVIQQYAGEIRHFSYGFRIYIEALLEPLQKCVVSGTALKGAMPDGDEYLLLGHSSAALSSSIGGNKTPNCSSIVATGVEMVFPDGITFTKEVYAANKLVSGKNNVFRALLGENDIHLGRASTIIRWAHAVGALRAEPDCDLHGRISSDLEIQLESGCAFQRLNAPCIALGYSKAEVPDVAETEEISLPIGRRLVDEDLEVKAGEVVTINIVTRGRLHIGAGARVLGSVKSNQHMTLDANVSVEGSLISASTMHIGPHCRIAGPVIAEHGMAIETGTRCGSIGTPTTVTAPTIEIADGVMVFGTVWARTEGHVVPKR